jgi:hypothetical protein
MQDRAELEQLLLDVVHGLKRAGLQDSMRTFHERFLSRPPHQLFEITVSTSGASEWQFKPMVELLLREISAITAADSRSVEARQAEIECVMTLAGF